MILFCIVETIPARVKRKEERRLRILPDFGGFSFPREARCWPSKSSGERAGTSPIESLDGAEKPPTCLPFDEEEKTGKHEA
jgi:hypothetical protein